MRRRNNKSILFGIAFTTIAILLLLSALNVITGSVIYIGISAIMVLYGITALFNKSFYVGIYGIAFGFRYCAEYYKHIIDFTQVGYWQLFLIATLLAFGLQLIFGRGTKKYVHVDYDFDIPAGHEHSNIGEDYVNIQTYLKETTRYIYSTNLELVDLETKLGSTSVFFQERELNQNLTIYVDCKLGNLELFLPREWVIQENINTQLGNVDIDYNRNQTAIMSPYVVSIEGNVTMGNIEIHFI